MSLDAMWLFLYAVMREPILALAAITTCFGVALVLLSAFNRVGKQD